jgi:hypothetical protein
MVWAVHFYNVATSTSFSIFKFSISKKAKLLKVDKKVQYVFVPLIAEYGNQIR